MRVLILLMAFFLSGCGALDRGLVWFTGNASEVCKNEVLYYQFTSGSTAAYNKDGSLITCD